MAEERFTYEEEAVEGEINLLQLLLVVARRKMFIIKVCAVAMLFSAGFALSMKNVYTATSKYYPPQRESALGGLASLLVQSGPLQGLGGLGGPGDVYMAITKSRTVADAVVKRLDLQKGEGGKILNPEAARNRAMGAVKVTSGKDGIITVAASSRDPKKAAELANAFVDETVKRSIQLYVTKAGTEKSFLEKRLETVKVDLQNAEGEMRSFQEKHKTIKVDAQAAVAIDAIAKLRAEIAHKEVQLATLRNSMTDESSEVKSLQAGIARLKSQVGALTGKGGADNIIPATGDVPGLGTEYLRKVRDLKVQEAIFEQLSKQYEMAKINETKNSSTVQIIDEAVPPLRKSKPRRVLIVLASTVMAFFGSLVIIIVQDYSSRISPQNEEILKEIKESLRFRRREH